MTIFDILPIQETMVQVELSSSTTEEFEVPPK